jgi:cytochrome c oxidase subunit 4
VSEEKAMLQMKEKETKWLNLILLALAGLSVIVAAWTLYNYELRAGTDDLFLVFVCLLLAGLFAISPAMDFVRKNQVADEAHPSEEAIHEEKAERRESQLVWGGLLSLTAIEVFLAYIHLQPLLMITILMLLSIMKAALIIAYFMHMKFERMSFVLTIVPTLVVLLCLFAIFFPDSFRLNQMKPAQSVAPVEHSQQSH